MKDQWKIFVVPFVRAMLQLLSGWLLAKGIISPEDSSNIVGAAESVAATAVFAGTVAWSYREKKKTAELHAAKDEIIAGQQNIIQAKTEEIASLK